MATNAEETKRPAITYAEAGIDAPQDDTPRVPLVDGSTFIALRAEVRPSKKYGEYVVVDGETLDGDPFHAYTASQVILEQVKTMLAKYGDGDGTLSSAILCSVISRASSTSGRRFLSLV